MKDILITGAYGGMGRAAAIALRDGGFRVFALDKTVADDREERIIPIQADITVKEEVDAAFQMVGQYTESLFAILHFAGIYMLDSLVELEETQFRRIFDINLHGAFLINRTFFPLLKRGSRILITTSELASLDPLPFTGIYGVTKAALDKYAYALRMELQLLDISVSVLRAGAVNTGMLGASTDALDRFCQKTALYPCNAARFKRIVERVEARHISPEKLACRVLKILKKKKPAFAYSINRNPLLRLLSILPKKWQCSIIRRILR